MVTGDSAGSPKDDPGLDHPMLWWLRKGPRAEHTPQSLASWPQRPLLTLTPPSLRVSQTTASTPRDSQRGCLTPEVEEGGGASTEGLSLPFPLELPYLAVPNLVPQGRPQSPWQHLSPASVRPQSTSPLTPAPEPFQGGEQRRSLKRQPAGETA